MHVYILCGNSYINIFSSAVPRGSGAFQMPDSSVVGVVVDGVNFKGGRANLRNASVTFFLFFGMKLLWDDINNIS